MADPLFTPEVRLLLERDDRATMETFCETLHPATVAEALTDSFSVEQIWHFLRSTDREHQAAIFAYFPLEMQMELVEEGLGREQIAHMIEEMSSDDRANLLRQLPDPVRESLLRLVDEADRKDIARLIQYPENTAGAMMTTDYAWLPANITAGEALERLRLMAPNTETIYYVYIVDDQRRLMGVVSLRDLILAPRRAILSDLMATRLFSIRDTDDSEHVAQVFAEYDLLAMPVVDADNRLVGIITSDDVVDVVVEAATEDVHRMGAVGPLEQDYLHTSFLRLWGNRAFWLSCLFVAELFTFTALSYFEEAIAEVVVLSLFVPLCISTGGNSGSQAATLITRALALGQIGPPDWFRVLRHEIAMGVVLGLTLGLIGFLRASVTPESVRGSSPPRREAFVVVVDQPLEIRREKHRTWLGHEHVTVHAHLPAGTGQTLARHDEVTIDLPDDADLDEPTRDAQGRWVYQFPARCSLEQPPVPRWSLAWVIGLSVASICLWGTLMGSMLPLVFRRFGIDPGIASSPFVATFVDVTGIVIYFSIARSILWQLLH
ncbi:MAG: magnesium transporter [Gemmataceae bacterium]